MAVLNPIVILVIGSRRWSDRTIIDVALDTVARAYAGERQFHFVQGGAAGAERMARDYALEHQWEMTEVPAEWELYRLQYGRTTGAGHVRNAHMLKCHRPIYILAFAESLGERSEIHDCWARARQYARGPDAPPGVPIRLRHYTGMRVRGAGAPVYTEKIIAAATPAHDVPWSRSCLELPTARALDVSASMSRLELSAVLTSDVLGSASCPDLVVAATRDVQGSTSCLVLSTEPSSTHSGME